MSNKTQQATLCPALHLLQPFVLLFLPLSYPLSSSPAAYPSSPSSADYTCPACPASSSCPPGVHEHVQCSSSLCVFALLCACVFLLHSPADVNTQLQVPRPMLSLQL